MMTLLLWKPGSQQLRQTPGCFCLSFPFTFAIVCLLITPFSTSGLHLNLISYQIKCQESGCSCPQMQGKELMYFLYISHVQRQFIPLSATFILPSSPSGFSPRDIFIIKFQCFYSPYFVYHMADILFIINDGSIW